MAGPPIDFFGLMCYNFFITIIKEHFYDSISLYSVVKYKFLVA